MLRPATSGYDPWIGSNKAFFSPMEAEGINPIDPEITDASSVRISPNKFSVISTS